MAQHGDRRNPLSPLTRPFMAGAVLLLVAPAGMAAQGHIKTPQTAPSTVIRSVQVAAPAARTTLTNALRPLRGMPLTPAVRRTARLRLEGIVSQQGWINAGFHVPAQTAPDGHWDIRVTGQLPSTPRRPAIARAAHLPTRALTARPSATSPLPDHPRFAAWLGSPEYAVLILLDRRELFAKLGGTVQRFPVGVGRRRSPTPAGVYKIQSVAYKPVWYPTRNIRARALARGAALPRQVPPGPGNPLGDWFIALGGSIGIHGTNAPRSIGRYVSSGCIRMHNDHVEALAPAVSAGQGVLILPALPRHAGAATTAALSQP